MASAFATVVGRLAFESFLHHLAAIRDRLFTPDDYAQILAKVVLVADEAAMVAEDDQGGSYNFGQEGFPSVRPTPRASEWLGVRPRPEEH